MTLRYRAFLVLHLFGITMTHGHLRKDASEPLSVPVGRGTTPVPVAQNDEEYGPEGWIF